MGDSFSPNSLIKVGQNLPIGIGLIAESLHARRESKNKPQKVDSAEESIDGIPFIPTGRLDLPVILPQRRPKERSRGFLRAYAPLLRNVDIDQQMWLKFLNDFDESTQATGWIKVINLASLASHVVPEPFSMLVSIAVKETIRVAEEIDSRQKTNKFLDKANAEIFRPRGVICMVMTWRPDTTQVHPTIDFNNPASSSVPTDDEFGKVKEKFKESSGTTVGDLKIPAAAPLVFPSETQLQQQQQAGSGELSWKEKFKQKKAFMDDYLDRRAQAEYAAENPDNILATQHTTQFSSKYADPNHPANMDPLGSFLTNGHTDQLHLENKARTNAAQAQAQKAVADARQRADAAQAQARQAAADAQARAREAQMRAGYYTPPAASSPYYQPPLYAGRPGAPAHGYASEVPAHTYAPPVAVPGPLNPLSQALMDGSQRLVETQQKYINAGTRALQNVMQTNVLYLMVVSLPTERELEQVPRPAGDVA